MSDDLAKERHDMLLERIRDLKEGFSEELDEIRTSIKETCAALTAHAKQDDGRYAEFQNTDQTVKTAHKMIKVSGAVVGAIGFKEVWDFFRR